MTELTPKTLTLFEQLQQMHSPTRLDVRGENAWAVGVKFIRLLESAIPEEEEQHRLIRSFLKAIRDSDFKKFRRVLHRYRRTHS